MGFITRARTPAILRHRCSEKLLGQENRSAKLRLGVVTGTGLKSHAGWIFHARDEDLGLAHHQQSAKTAWRRGF
jgi:hypothetical protein